MPKSDNITEVVDLDAEQTDVRHNVAPDAEADQQTEVSSNDSPEEDAEDTGRGNNREERFRKERRALATQLAVEQARGAERDRRDIERIAAATLVDPTEIGATAPTWPHCSTTKVCRPMRRCRLEPTNWLPHAATSPRPNSRAHHRPASSPGTALRRSRLRPRSRRRSAARLVAALRRAG